MRRRIQVCGPAVRLSDAVIAWNRFIGPVPARTWIVMITYYLAQYLFFRFAFKTAARN